MPRQFELENSPDGINLVVTGAWTSAAEATIRDQGVDGLVLNYARGFNERTLDFLVGLPIARLEIMARTLTDLSPLYSLAPTLTHLALTTGRAPVDLGLLPRVVSLHAEWKQVRESIASLPRLREIWVQSFTEPNLQSLRGNRAIELIVMKNGAALETLDGIEEFTQLAHLALPRSGVVDLSPLHDLTLLSRIEFEACRGIDELEVLAALRQLKFVNFSQCGELASVEPLRDLTELETVLMWGSTRVVDGDLSALAALPRLRTLRMQERSHYTPPARSIAQAIGDV